MKNSRIGDAFPMGATVIGKKSVQFVSRINSKKETCLVLYEKNTGEKEEYKLSKEYRKGNMYSIIVDDIDPAKYTYNYTENGREILDPYAKVVCGNEIWGAGEHKQISAGIKIENFKWEDDKSLMYSYENSVIYQLHVRGFTKHLSSKVKKKGTFEGLCEKIPYLKKLGITAVELLPAYEFMECEDKINYWGFKEACYFAPKASYSAGKNPVNSFKNMVKELHKAEIEVIMQFYFPHTIERSYILEVIKYWVKEYHIDGVRLLGVNIPISVIATQPELLNTKIMHENIPLHEIYDYQYAPAYKNLANYNDGYLYAVRRFLKGDIGSLQGAFKAILNQQNQAGNMVYLTNYNTFTLNDMVSYDRKHNDANGERGKDGNNNNLSWNCGVEGPTKRKYITAIREKQMRNAITFLMLSKGTPVIVAGDEFGNSQEGNNNPYCQDNTITWLNWKDLEKNREQFEFMKKMILFMKEHPILKKTKDQVIKRNGEEYPYMSFHGVEAWKLDWSEANEETGGILYYDEYNYLYIVFNMSWQENTVALPGVPGNHKWEVVIDTSGEQEGEWIGKERGILVPSRTIKIIAAKGSESDFDENLSAF